MALRNYQTRFWLGLLAADFALAAGPPPTPPQNVFNFGKIAAVENCLALRCARGFLLVRSKPGRGASENWAMAPPFMAWRALSWNAAEREEMVARGGGSVLVLCLAILSPTRRRIFFGAVPL